jgi:Tfp pilus assembly protein PilN
MVELGRREVTAKMGIKNHDLDLIDSQAIKANDVIMLKALSWTRLFNRLEKLQPYDVRMQAIRPVFNLGKKTGTRERVTTASSGDLEAQSVMVTVEGTAKNFEAFLELETALLQDPWFDRIEPERYSRLTRQETQFTLKFHYYPNKKQVEPPPEDEEDGSSGPADGTEGTLAAKEARR